jgi:hypothetical protein
MGDKLSKTVSVDFGELLNAFEFANFALVSDHAAYVDLKTGEIYCVTGQEDLDEEIPDDIDESDDYLALPDKSSLDLGNRLVFSFAEQEMPDEYDIVRDIFRKKGAYRRLKELLHAKGRLEQWYEFELQATKQALRHWCRANRIELTNT